MNVMCRSRNGAVNRAVNQQGTMDDKLLEGSVGGGPRKSRAPRGSKGRKPGSSSAGRSATGGGRTKKADDDDGDWPWTKRLRLQRHPSFASDVDEDRQTVKSSDTG